MEFLWFQVDAIAATLSLTPHKIHAKELRHALSCPWMSLLHLARIFGLLTTSIKAIFPATLHYRALQWLRVAYLRKGASYADWMSLDPESKEDGDMEWDSDLRHCPRGHHRFGRIHSGFGCMLQGSIQEGPLDPQVRNLHINALELLAGSFAIKSFTRDRADSSICLRMNNVSAFRYMNHLGGTWSLVLARMGSVFWSFCLEWDIYIPDI